MEKNDATQHWRVHIATDLPGDWKLHWGCVDAAVVARGHATTKDLCASVADAPWTRPDETYLPETISGGEQSVLSAAAATTPMQRSSTQDTSSTTLTFYGPTSPAAVKFCLTDGGRQWIKDDGETDFVVPLPVSWSERMSAYALELEEESSSASSSEGHDGDENSSRGFLAAAIDTFGVPPIAG